MSSKKQPFRFTPSLDVVAFTGDGDMSYLEHEFSQTKDKVELEIANMFAISLREKTGIVLSGIKNNDDPNTFPDIECLEGNEKIGIELAEIIDQNKRKWQIVHKQLHQDLGILLDGIELYRGIEFQTGISSRNLPSKREKERLVQDISNTIMKNQDLISNLPVGEKISLECRCMNSSTLTISVYRKKLRSTPGSACSMIISGGYIEDSPTTTVLVDTLKGKLGKYYDTSGYVKSILLMYFLNKSFDIEHTRYEDLKALTGLPSNKFTEIWVLEAQYGGRSSLLRICPLPLLQYGAELGSHITELAPGHKVMTAQIPITAFTMWVDLFDFDEEKLASLFANTLLDEYKRELIYRRSEEKQMYYFIENSDDIIKLLFKEIPSINLYNNNRIEYTSLELDEHISQVVNWIHTTTSEDVDGVCLWLRDDKLSLSRVELAQIVMRKFDEIGQLRFKEFHIFDVCRPSILSLSRVEE